jgi:predicted regulator of Ras-like GTPase activity (Roadblock/LC7/MglB family)
MLDTRYQPSLESLLQRMGEEISAKAVLLLHESGQVLHQFGQLQEGEFPAMAALVSAMIATGKSLGSLGESFAEAPRRLACDSDEVGLYTVAVGEGIWLVALYDQPLNPGLVRMKVRRCAEACARLGADIPEPWEVPEIVTPKAAPETRAHQPVGANLSPPVALDTIGQAKITEDKNSLFNNITDDEIDRLFENTHS